MQFESRNMIKKEKKEQNAQRIKPNATAKDIIISWWQLKSKVYDSGC